ncbi:winged helix-turn-helix domain-containing protein [Pseudoalteromonas sp. SMS1]|uniref:ArsR/SmtB family transcription factor n=1 Tax=Pseudoalteromonas sp. SMS1 TaxID=2908894 RepID=UPI001F3F6ED2|nr:winged helix-turn-helix domain-containing protein [Pseudoalteromonas sp. SMS1]MCF2856967.1 winged helix-turn-helix domain-containing protein [Pseudoalteromonas sp. SMS1]
MEPNISIVAGLIADPTRAKILTALMGGKALTATELAIEADVTPQTASSHLSKLVAGALLQVRKQGRHKYFQLKGLAIAELLEQLLVITTTAQTTVKTGPNDTRLQYARVCYDHLAGALGVKLYDALVARGILIDAGEQTQLTEKGRIYFIELGVDIEHLQTKRRPVCKSCLDWSERRNHLAGSLGQWVLEYIFDKGWAERDLDARSVRFSESGLKAFKRMFLREV